MKSDALGYPPSPIATTGRCSNFLPSGLALRPAQAAQTQDEPADTAICPRLFRDVTERG
jgi:hypothetical protein